MKTKKILTELTDLEPAEVSLVDKGANEKKRFPIFKQEDRQMDDFSEILKAVLETEVDEEAKLAEIVEKAKISEKGLAALKSALRILSSYKDELPSDALDKLAAAAGYPAPKGEEKKASPESKDKAKKAKKEDDEEEDMTCKDKVKKEEGETMEEITKAQAEIETLKNDLKVERDNRQTEEWIRKAETELSHFPGKSSKELGAMLKQLADVNPELAQAQFDSMKAASEAMKQSNILKSAGGASAENDSDAMSKIEKLADGIVEKSADPKMTREKAVVLVMKRNPELYTQYLDEHPAQRRSAIYQ